MQTAKLRAVLDGIAALQGAEPYTVGDPDFIAAVANIGRHLERGWQHDFFPEWSPTERRAFRDAWDAGETYAAGDEVYFEDDDAYYTANSAPNNPAAGESPATDEDKWTVLTSFAKYIALEQPGKTVIAEVSRLCKNDPDVNPLRPGEIPHKMTALGIVPMAACGSRVYVTFRKPVPQFTATEWDAAEAYAADDLVYDDETGECYKAVQAGTNHAVTDEAYWERVEFPARLKNFVTVAAYADALRGDDQTGKAQAEARNADLALVLAHDAAFAGQG
jgi:hypothetical protein